MKPKDTDLFPTTTRTRAPVPPKNTVDLSSDAGRARVLQAARKVMREHEAVIKALAKR